MKLAFCIFKYFPYGGLQRDFFRIASLCMERGHEIHVYTMEWEGEKKEGFILHFIPVSSNQNHTKNKEFAEKVKIYVEQLKPDLIIGFNKMPLLDIYYAADVCYQARARQEHSWFYRLLPRYKQMLAFEKSVFNHGMPTKILLIAEQQKSLFQQYYQTEDHRFYLLPPGISRDRMAPVNAAQIRASLRDEWQLLENDFLLLFVGSGFKTKGLDRAITALAALPEHLKTRSYLFVIGQDDEPIFKKLSAKMHVADRVKFLGGRPDVADFLLAADLLVHPAYFENTGTILLEAMVAGLPVLTTDVCGYAHYINDANAGMVMSSPFKQLEFNTTLEKMLLSPFSATWKKNGLYFAKHADIYHLVEKAVAYIERIE